MTTSSAEPIYHCHGHGISDTASPARASQPIIPASWPIENTDKGLTSVRGSAKNLRILRTNFR